MDEPEQKNIKRIAKLAIIGKNKILITTLLLLSAIVAISTLIIILAGGGEPCFGCVILYPIYFASLPALPVFKFLSWLFSQISYSFNYSDDPSLLKFLPVVVVSTYSFLLGFFLSLFFLNLRKSDLGKKETKERMRHAKQKFLFYYVIFIILVSSFIFIQNPPAPFASNEAMVKSCRGSEECWANFVHYKAPNCEGKSKLFLYPLKVQLPSMDECVLENFIKKRIFKDIRLTQGHSDIVWIYTREDTGRSFRQNMDLVFTLFAPVLASVSSEDKLSFCSSFSDKDYDPEIRQDIISNKQYCVKRIGN